ncbi:Trafficking protein particle complex subunit 9 [Branchiostoma belcheri]|nr:Trafficking protein particle complex subunit 9 [Branchiostoma belcheri]
MATVRFEKRFLLLTISVLEMLLFSGIIYGWTSLVYILKQEGYFSDSCNTTTTDSQVSKLVKARVTTRRTCICVTSTCKNVGKRRAFVRGAYHLRTESYGFGSTQTCCRTSSACKTFSTCGLRIHHTYVRVRATRMSCTAYERTTHVFRKT